MQGVGGWWVRRIFRSFSSALKRFARGRWAARYLSVWEYSHEKKIRRMAPCMGGLLHWRTKKKYLDASRPDVTCRLYTFFGHLILIQAFVASKKLGSITLIFRLWPVSLGKSSKRAKTNDCSWRTFLFDLYFFILFYFWFVSWDSLNIYRQ